MRPKATAEPSDSPAPGVIPATVHVNGEQPVAPPADAPVESTLPVETREERLRREAHRRRLYGYAFVAVALFAFLIALAASNTARVKVSWVFGTSHVKLVWLVLFAAILGWLLGILITAALRWRTRAPGH
jgi:uncharacterized integral membrane protein